MFLAKVEVKYLFLRLEQLFFWVFILMRLFISENVCPFRLTFSLVHLLVIIVVSASSFAWHYIISTLI